MKRTSQIWRGMAAFLLVLLSVPVVHAPAWGDNNTVSVFGLVGVANFKANVEVRLQKPNGEAVSGASITFNNTPVPPGSSPGSYLLSWTPVGNLAPLVLNLVIKLPSPPYAPQTIIKGTAKLHRLVEIIRPQENQAFVRGVGSGVQVYWRTLPGPGPAWLSINDCTHPVSSNKSLGTCSSYVVPWSMFPGSCPWYYIWIYADHDITFSFAGPATANSKLRATAYSGCHVTISQ